MVYSNINKPFSKGTMVTVNHQENVVYLADEGRNQNDRNNLLTNPNKFSTRKIVNLYKGASLVMNISSLFFHVMYINSCQIPTFHYLYNSCKSVNKINSKFEMDSIKDAEKNKALSKSNIVESAVVYLNIFNDRCCCEKCLSACFVFDASKDSDLRKEFLRIFSSEYCRHWRVGWLQTLIEQIFIFLSCITGGIVNEEQLECAAVIVKICLSKTNVNYLIEMKHSYVSFHMNLMNMAKLEKAKMEQVHLLKVSPTAAPGSIFKRKEKEEEEIIDGVRVISFLSEADMKEYTDFEVKHLNRFQSMTNENSCEREIVLTKTNNITKIKGWKRKLFSTLASPKNNISDHAKSAEIENRNQSFEKRKEKIINLRIKAKKHEKLFDRENSGDVVESVYNQNQLLLGTFDCKLKAGQPPTDFGPAFIPIIHKCGLMSNISKRRVCECKRFTLGMVLNIGIGRSLSNKTVENLELLYNKNEIDERRATIASSALSLEKKRQISNIIVPVVSEKILNSFKNWEQGLAYDEIASTIPNSSSSKDIDPCVIRVVQELEYYVERKLEVSDDVPYDPIYTSALSQSPEKDKKKKVSKIIRDLINVSVIEESEQTKKGVSKYGCGNDFCLKGCVCYSLNNRVCNVPLHCGKIACMFECSCPYMFRFCRNAIKEEHDLTKEERAWQQTFNSSEHGNKIEFINKSKRELNLPTRFRNNVLMGDEICSYLTLPTNETPTREFLVPKRAEKSSNAKIKKGISFKKRLKERRFDFCTGKLKGAQTLADVFIWCAIHDKYNCLCESWIGRLKSNECIWKPNKSARYLAYKVMLNMKLRSNSCQQLYLYDVQRFSARTYGTPIEYLVRNRSKIFLEKRKCELEHGIISCTNSFTKMKFFMVKDSEISSDNEFETEFDHEVVIKSSKNENVYITNSIDEEEEDMEIQIVDVDQVKIIRDNDNDVPLFAVDMTTNQILNFSYKEGNQFILPAQSVNHLMKQPLQGHSGSGKKITAAEAVVSSPKKWAPEFKVKQDNIKASEKKEHSLIDFSSRIVCNTSNVQKKLNSKKNVIPSLERHLIKEIDIELENELVKLEEHTEREALFGPDKLPKLALMCLTPGIGFLPVLEFKNEILLTQDPVFCNIYHSFKNLNAANLWLNRFFKNRLIFESIDTNLKWVIVKPGILKLKNCRPFNTSLFDNSTIIITKEGGLSFKRNSCNIVVRVRDIVKPLPPTGPTQVTFLDHYNIKRKIIYETEETNADISNSIGKKRKLEPGGNTYLWRSFSV